MALTTAQLKAIQQQAKKNVAVRAATQAKKISEHDAKWAGSQIRKSGTPNYKGTYQDKPVMTKSIKAELGKQSKTNATIEKNRSFAKGETKLAKSARVGTKAEYKALGEEIKLKAALHKKAASIKAKPAAAAPAPKSKPVTPKAPKASTAAIKARTTKSTTPKAPKGPQTLEQAKASAPKPKTAKGPQTLTEAKASAPKPKGTSATKLQTLDEAKAKAPKPGVIKYDTTTSGPTQTETKAANKISKAVSETKVGKTVKAANKAFGPSSEVGKAISTSKVGKLAKAGGKVLKVGARIGQVVAAGAEAKQVVSGQAEKDFRRIQALENKIAIAKGQKPKYTTTGSNKNLVSSIKTDLGVAANIVSAGVLGKTRKERLAELKGMLKTAKPASKSTKGATKPESTVSKPPVITSGSKYRVQHGDTLSGIASKAGVSLADLRAANPQLANKGIFRNTGVNIPKSGKVPTGGYSGPIPYKAGKKK